jgi:hypothetical protein
MACRVCGEAEPRPELLSECFGCDRPFHLNPYANRPGKDCGDAWIGDDALTLQFYCRDCIERSRREAGGAPPTRSDVGPAPGGSPVGTAAGTFEELFAGMEQLQALLDTRRPAPPGAPPPARRRPAAARRRYRRID